MIQVMKPALEVVVDMVLGPPHNIASSLNPTGPYLVFFRQGFASELELWVNDIHIQPLLRTCTEFIILDSRTLT